VGFSSNVVASVEALLGLLAFSITTGIIYGRFSKAVPKILYSDLALISPYLDSSALMIKTANERSNQLINVEASIIFSRNETVNGVKTRKYYPLDLERKTVKYFSLSWTIVHPITSESPLYGENKESLAESEAEILLSIDGTNDTFSDPIHSRKSFYHTEMFFGRKFENIIGTENGSYILDLNKINETVEAPIKE
jgi:inward rectifier potassium channel